MPTNSGLMVKTNFLLSWKEGVKFWTAFSFKEIMKPGPNLIKHQDCKI